MILLPFEWTVPEDKKNKNLAEELKEELPGIFNWAYQEMVDVEKNGFVVPVKCKEAIEQYHNDPNSSTVVITYFCKKALMT